MGFTQRVQNTRRESQTPAAQGVAAVVKVRTEEVER